MRKRPFGKGLGHVNLNEIQLVDNPCSRSRDGGWEFRLFDDTVVDDILTLIEPLKQRPSLKLPPGSNVTIVTERQGNDRERCVARITVTLPQETFVFTVLGEYDEIEYSGSADLREQLLNRGIVLRWNIHITDRGYVIAKPPGVPYASRELVEHLAGLNGLSLKAPLGQLREQVMPYLTENAIEKICGLSGNSHTHSTFRPRVGYATDVMRARASLMAPIVH